MVNDQVDPLPTLEGDESRTLTEQLSGILLLLSTVERKSNSNSKGLFAEDIQRSRSLMAAYLLPGGGCLSYILERRAFTIPVVEAATGIGANLVFSVVRRLINGGMAHEVYRVGGHGRPASLYALYDASDKQVEEAAALYRDQNDTHVKRLEDYTVESIYHKVAEEVAKNHLIQGMASTSAVARLLADNDVRGDKHHVAVHRLLRGMGLELIQA